MNERNDMTRRGVLAGLCVGALVVVLGGCDEQEQNRPLRYEKGTYGGPRDPALDEAKLQDLRQRARQQSGL
jgi:hypothetical protein